METLAYSGCLAENRLTADLAPGAEMMGWDLLGLGLPAANRAWERGLFTQQLELPGVWLERSRVSAHDPLLKSPLGWAGQTVLATLWFAAGTPLASARRDALLDAARNCVLGTPLASNAGVTAPQSRVLVLRVLAPQVEPAMRLLAAVRATWRAEAWGLKAEPPRIWRT